MDKDPFGNLMEWGAVLDQLNDLELTGKLADCQLGLIRILRFKGNWRLRETVLKSVTKIETPKTELLAEVLNIIMDDNIYYEARILASEALQQMIGHCRSLQKDHETLSQVPVADKLNLLMKTPQPPIFFTAIDNCLKNLK
ncbi:MAG: hypothetical protein KKF00_11910 [Proteobacteria bacterium]|nr:hypothetical protein [Pseudomonadota bacterium]